MSKNTVYDAEQMSALRSDYLTATIIRQEALARWKALEKRRSLLGVLMAIATLVGLLTAIVVWLPYRTNLQNFRGYLFAGIAFGLGLLLCAAFGICRAVTTATARRTYLECYTAELAIEENADAIKAATLDPVLHNSIVISARSVITAPPYEYPEEPIDHPENANCTNEKRERGEKVQKYKKDKKKCTEAYEVFKGPVNSATVFIDGHEIGALDLCREFSVFRVSPGVHTVKLKLRKNYSTGKELLLETTPLTFMVNDNYHICLYTVDAQLQGGRMTYALKLAEYDDITTFRRDILDTDRLEKLEREAELSERLSLRAECLYRELQEQPKYKELFADQKVRRYARQKHRYLNSADAPLNNDTVREYGQKAKMIAKKMLIVQNDPSISEQKKAARLRSLDEELTLLAHELYNRINAANDGCMVGLEETKLKNILLLGQENIHCEDIARTLRHEAGINA